jgi:FkbM family methyltransferase
MSWIRTLLQKVLSEKQYLRVLATGFQRLYRSGRLGNDYQDVYFLKNIIRPGDTCADIGAHLGYYTMELSRIVGDQGHVIAIEPVSKFNSVLQQLTARRKNITLHKVALGGSGEFVEMGIPKIGNQKKFAHARIQELSTWLEYVGTEKVKNVKGDDLFANLPRLDYIKCDVEGAEVMVFSSMPITLQKHQPALLCELNEKSERIKMFDMLRHLNYETYLLRSGKLHKIDVQSDERPISHNHYFIPASRLEHYKRFIAQ